MRKSKLNKRREWQERCRTQARQSRRHGWPHCYGAVSAIAALVAAAQARPHLCLSEASRETIAADGS